VIALVHGAPGTGKTLLASAVAGELGLPLYRVEVARLAEPRAQLAALFDAADYAGAVLVLAEVDALLADRAALGYLAQRLDHCDGIVIVTARAGAAVDAALRRQLAFRFALLFPDEDAREQLWRLHLPAHARRGAIDLAQLAQRYALSGASIRAAATRAAFLAVEEQAALSADHLERAIRAELRELAALAPTSAIAPAPVD
jgi:SpoVK/Ycf46/Vps4 family AAA+-type ATPase